MESDKTRYHCSRHWNFGSQHLGPQEGRNTKREVLCSSFLRAHSYSRCHLDSHETRSHAMTWTRPTYSHFSVDQVIPPSFYHWQAAHRRPPPVLLLSSPRGILLPLLIPPIAPPRTNQGLFRLVVFLLVSPTSPNKLLTARPCNPSFLTDGCL